MSQNNAPIIQIKIGIPKNQNPNIEVQNPKLYKNPHSSSLWYVSNPKTGTRLMIQENDNIIKSLQLYSIIQSRKQHAKHHFSPYASNFCAITPFVNPILECIHFWRILELILRIVGIKSKRGTEVRLVDGKFY